MVRSSVLLQSIKTCKFVTVDLSLFDDLLLSFLTDLIFQNI